LAISWTLGIIIDFPKFTASSSSDDSIVSTECSMVKPFRNPVLGESAVTGETRAPHSTVNALVISMEKPPIVIVIYIYI
jgi:hypothetical protein